jgi:hypothetical protein
MTGALGAEDEVMISIAVVVEQRCGTGGVRVPSNFIRQVGVLMLKIEVTIVVEFSSEFEHLKFNGTAIDNKGNSSIRCLLYFCLYLS